ncbi:transcription termination/antitermination protein NusG [Pseudorhodobacter ferrugineus]|uniref:transcription termination/antitermination protein NusG n=1 Tax=Pseudorhodobacter ferrugineus TaxID=77008 RepID=UPI0003B34CB0|nr:transcription termination/antitermination NusG family protein [Pseudorhodobacter ferrugineus]
MLSYHPDNFTAAQWHLLLCKPNQNHIAFRNLKRLGFGLFMPRHLVERRVKGRALTELRPLFGGYLFLNMNPSEPRWYDAKTASGVSKIIGHSTGGPSVVPPDIIAGLLQRCDRDGLLQETVENFSAGDTVRIIGGPFANFITSIEKIDPDRRLHVLLDLMGRPTKVLVDPTMVDRCP